MKNFQNIVSDVMNAGIKIYPVYFKQDTIISGVIYKAYHWYIKVEFPTRNIIYNKPVASGARLDSEKHPDYVIAIKKTYEHLYNELKKTEE